MILHIAGVQHFDPSGPVALRSWLMDQGQSGAVAPAFLATEWNHDAFAAVEQQRPAFRQLLAREWPYASRSLLDVLERSLGYEGDAHLLVYPDSEVLWLGPQPTPEDQHIGDYANDRLSLFRSFLQGARLPDRIEVALQVLGDAARRRAKGSVGGTQRDRDFATKIMNKARGLAGTWAAVAVGANHAADNGGSMRRVLEDVGYTCRVAIL